jgi:iron complex outermembrane receptor protein
LFGGAGGGGFFGGGRGGGGGGDGRGRWFFNLTYTREIKNQVLVAPGGPLLDLINGDALSGGGQPRNSFNVTGGLFYHGFGTRYSVRYTGESRLNGSGLPGSTDLFFDNFLTVDLRVFADLNQQAKLIKDVPLLKNTRISFGVDNVFDARQRVVDSTGATPLRYQPFLIDPVGRQFSIELRKMF